MTVNLDALVQSISNYSTKSKGRIKKINDEAVSEVNSLIDKLTIDFDLETVDMGAPNGGEFNVALTENYAVVSDANIDCAAANHFQKTVTAAVTLKPVNVPPAGRVAVMLLHIVNGGTNVTFWANVKWAGGVKPTLTVSGRDVLSFSTKDGGLTWDGYVVGLDVK